MKTFRLVKDRYDQLKDLFHHYSFNAPNEMFVRQIGDLILLHEKILAKLIRYDG